MAVEEHERERESAQERVEKNGVSACVVRMCVREGEGGRGRVGERRCCLRYDEGQCECYKAHSLADRAVVSFF